VAELDGAGNVVSRFVYATRGNVPDYMEKGGSTYRSLKVSGTSFQLATTVTFDAASGVTVSGPPQ